MFFAFLFIGAISVSKKSFFDILNVHFGNVSIDFSKSKFLNPGSLIISPHFTQFSYNFAKLRVFKSINPFIQISSFTKLNIQLQSSSFSSFLAPVLITEGVDALDTTYTQTEKTELERIYDEFRYEAILNIRNCVFNGIRSSQNELFRHGGALSLSTILQSSSIRISDSQFIDCQTIEIVDRYDGGAIYIDASGTEGNSRTNAVLENVAFLRCASYVGSAFYITSSTRESLSTISISNFNITECYPANVTSYHCSFIHNFDVQKYEYGLFQTFADPFFGRLVYFSNCNGIASFLQFTSIATTLSQPIIYIESNGDFQFSLAYIGFTQLQNCFPLYVKANQGTLQCDISNIYSVPNTIAVVGSAVIEGTIIPEETNGLNIPTQSNVFTASLPFTPSNQHINSNNPIISFNPDEENESGSKLNPNDIGMIVGIIIAVIAVVVVIIITVYFCKYRRVRCCFTKAFHPDSDENSNRELYFFENKV